MSPRLTTGLASLIVCTASTPALADVVVTPRFTGYFDNSNQRQTGLEGATTPDPAATSAINMQLQSVFGPSASLVYTETDAAGRASQVFFPMIGASISFSLDPERRTQITATAMYGKGNAAVSTVGTAKQRVTLLGFAADDVFVSRGSGQAKFTRLDLELTAQHRLNETFSVMGGLRFERFGERATITTASTGSKNASNLIDALGGGFDPSFGLLNDTFVGQYKTRSVTYSIRAGGAAYVPVGVSQQIYVNGLLHLNYAPKNKIAIVQTSPSSGTTSTSISRVASESAIGPDISVGYIRQLNSRASFDIRYRGLFYFPVSGSKSFDDPRVNHGISIGLSITL